MRIEGPRVVRGRSAIQTKTKTKLDDAGLDQWPPVAHIVHKDNFPIKKGTTALCGAKLMGIKLPGSAPSCKKCLQILSNS